jgi:uncharacterized membrane protein
MAATNPPYGAEIAAILSRLGGDIQFKQSTFTIPAAGLRTGQTSLWTVWADGIAPTTHDFVVYTPTTNDPPDTLQIYTVSITVLNQSVAHSYDAQLFSVDIENNVRTNYNSITGITQNTATIPAGNLVFASSGKQQQIGVTFTNNISSDITVTATLVYSINAPLPIPSVTIPSPPPSYTGARLDYVLVGPSQQIQSIASLFPNTQNLVCQAATTGATTLHVYSFPASNWQDGMMLTKYQGAPQVTNWFSPNTLATLIQVNGDASADISISKPLLVDLAENASVSATYSIIKDGGTIQLTAENHYAPCNIPQGFTHLTIKGTRIGTYTLGTVCSGRGGVGAGFRLSFGKGFIHTGSACTIQDIHFIECGGADLVGDGEAAVYAESFVQEGTLLVQNCMFDYNENGVFTPHVYNSGTANPDQTQVDGGYFVNVVIDHCDFGRISPNGASLDGEAHDFYLSSLSVIIKNSFFYGSFGNDLKCRSGFLTVQNCYVAHWQDRCIDYPNGGALVLQDSIFTNTYRDNVQTISNYIGFANEGATNTSVNPQFTNTWFTTGRYQDTWWMDDSVTAEWVDCPMNLLPQFGQTVFASWNMVSGGSQTADDTWTNVTYAGQSFGHFGGDANNTQTFPYLLHNAIAPMNAAINAVPIQSLTISNGGLAITGASGTVIGAFVLSPTAASMINGLGYVSSNSNQYIAICNDPGLTAYTDGWGYFELASDSSLDSTWKLTLAQSNVPAGVYNLTFIYMSNYSVPQTFTIPVTLVASQGMVMDQLLAPLAITSGTTLTHTFTAHMVGYGSAPTLTYSTDGTTYAALPGGATVTSTTASFTLTLSAGTYHVSIKDSSNNVSSSLTVNVAEAVLANVPSSIANGASISGATATLTAISTAYAVLINNGIEEGLRVAFSGSSVPTLTPFLSNVYYSLAIYDSAISGNLLASANVMVGTATYGVATVLQIPTGYTSPFLTCASSNGSIVAGYAFNAGNPQPLVWTNTSAPASVLPAQSGGGQVYGSSADGSILVGAVYDSSGNSTICYWQNETLHLLGSATAQSASAYAVSPDGSIIVGNYNQNTVTWINGTETTFTYGGVINGGTDSGYTCSTDGSIIYGIEETSGLAYFMKWVSGTATNLSANLHLTATNPITYISSVCASADGSVAAVTFFDATSAQGAYLWNGSALTPFATATPTDQTQVNGCTSDGSTFVGRTTRAGNPVTGAVWISGALQPLQTSVGYTQGTATAVAGDGSHIFGSAVQGTTNVAVMWTKN